MTEQEYFREKYNREIEFYKFSKKPVNDNLTMKDMFKITLVALLFAPVLYYGVILLMAMIYAVTGVR